MATEPKKPLELTDKDWKILREALKTHIAQQQRGYNSAPNELLKDAWSSMLSTSKNLQMRLDGG